MRIVKYLGWGQPGCGGAAGAFKHAGAKTMPDESPQSPGG